ncbi:MAG: MarR family transcriptional regulator [Pseudomonadota bacterium]
MSDALKYTDFEQACIAQALRRVARKVTRRYEAALRPVGLTMGQFTTLAALARPEAVPLTVLAEQLGMDRTTLTRDLAPLERRGLVASTPSPDDGRVRAIALTDAGNDLLSLAVPLWRKAQAESARLLDGADWAPIREQLDRLSA